MCVHVPYKLSWAFTLGEMLTACSGGKPYTSDFEQLKDLDTPLDFSKSKIWDSANSKFKSYVEDLFLELCSYYLDEYVLVSEKEDIEEADKYYFFRSLIVIMELTYDRYSTLLKSYSDSINELLEGLKSEGYNTSRFNDTPQGDETNFEYEDGDHVTNIRKDKNTIVTDNESRIARLNDLRSKYANVYKEWLKEFSGLFMSEGSLNIL